jgi:hypothetical protein
LSQEYSISVVTPHKEDTKDNNYLLYMDDLKLLGRNENDLKNGIKIVQTISKDININFVLEKCARICLKRCRV